MQRGSIGLVFCADRVNSEKCIKQISKVITAADRIVNVVNNAMSMRSRKAIAAK
jgi:hypothetical protein